MKESLSSKGGTSGGVMSKDFNEGKPDILAILTETGDPGTLIEGFTPVSWACMLGDFTLLEALINLGCSAKSRNIDGSTALTWAPSVEFARKLAEQGARVSEELPEGGDLSLHRSAGKGKSELLHYLATESDGASCLERCNNFGLTPLGEASKCGQLSCVTALLELGADPNGADPNLGAYTPLQLAIKNRHLNVAQALILGGADPTVSHRMVSTQYIANKFGFAQELLELESMARRQLKLLKRRAK